MKRLPGLSVRLLEPCLVWFREMVVCALVGALLLPGQLLQGAAPAWWGARDVLDPQKAVDNYAALNQGQLKNLVRAAVEEMNARLPGGAGSELNTLLAAWRASPLQANDHAMVNVGQLKAMASRIYQRLWDVGMPLASPWTTSTDDDDDYAAVNVGQAKAVFRFIVPDIVAMGDTDSDEDGYSDAVETAMGTDPNLASSAPAAAPPGFEPPLVQPTLKIYYRPLTGGAWMSGFSDWTGQTARTFTTKSTSLTSQKSSYSSGTDEWQSFRSSSIESNTWENVEVRQGIGASHMSQEEFLPAEITSNQSTYENHSEAAGVQLAAPHDNYFSDYKIEKTGGMESTETKLTYSYKNLGGSTYGPVTNTSVEQIPGGGSLLYLNDGPLPTRTDTVTTTTRTTSYQQDDVLYGGAAPITRSASGTMTETLSGEVTMAQVLSALKDDMAYVEGSSEQSSTSPSLTSYLSVYPNVATAIEYEYRFALEWPAGTADFRKDKSYRSFLVKEGYDSSDGQLHLERYKSVTISPNGPGETFRLSAAEIESSRSGSAYLTQVHIPLEISCPELYLFKGHDNDVAQLCKMSGIACQWRLKNSTPAIGTFDHPNDTACSFKATVEGKNTIQLVIAGAVIWEKPVEVMRIISRSEWGAAPARPLTDVIPTFQHLTLHHTSHTATGPAEMKRIQSLHMSLWPYNTFVLPGRGWDDIGYHFIMGKDGEVYEGRQLEVAPGKPGGPYTQGAHVHKNNSVAGLGFSTMGDYESTEGNEVWPLARQVALEKAVSAMCRRYKISASLIDYHKNLLLPTSTPNACPGSNFIPAIPSIIEHVRRNLQ